MQWLKAEGVAAHRRVAHPHVHPPEGESPTKIGTRRKPLCAKDRVCRDVYDLPSGCCINLEGLNVMAK